jgi:hypothetical protein
VKLNNFNAVYPFKGYVTESVNGTEIGLKIKLQWDKHWTLRCPDCGTRMAKNRESRASAFDLPCGSGPVVFTHFGTPPKKWTRFD